MSLKPPLPANASFASAAGGPARVVDGGSLGSSYTFALENDPNVWLLGTLNANCTVTVTGLTPGSLGLIMVTQDGVGGRTLSVSDGTTTTEVWTGGSADEPMTIVAACRDDDTLFVSVAGAQGIQGVAGEALGVLGYDVWNSQANPAAVTDWGPIINAAIAADHKLLLFGPHDFPYSTQIDASDVRGVQFCGESSYMGGPAQDGRTRLIWKGTGSGYAVDASSAAPDYGGGFYSEHIQWVYDNSGFTGYLFSFNNAFFAKFEHCVLSSATDSGTRTARGIDAHNMNTLVCSHCDFQQGLTVGVRGINAASAGFSNVGHFDGCTFETAALENPGRDWLFTHCVFQLNGLASGQAAIYDTAAYTTTTTVTLTLRDCHYWDVNAAPAPSTNRVVHNQYNWWQFAAHDCIDQDSGSSMAALYTLAKGGSALIATVNITGGNTNNDIDVGDAATAFKYRVAVENVMFSHNSAQLLNHRTGHGRVHVTGNHGLHSSCITGEGIVRVSHLRVNTETKATLSIPGGVVGIADGGILLGDAGGGMTLSNGTGSPSSTGIVADITFAHQHTISGSNGAVGVILGPGGNAAAAANFFVCKPYYTGTTFSKFSIGLNVALPAGESVGISYMVFILEPQ